MISLSKLLRQHTSYGDELRYRARPQRDKRPIVVWNSTQACNLACRHCYSDSRNQRYEGELSTAEAKTMLSDLRDFGVPVFLFSGGEPLTRPDLFELNMLARSYGLRTVISTNGTLIDGETAVRIRESGFSYVGVSLDGLSETHDRFRGRDGAFKSALNSVRYLIKAGQKTGLRFTVTRHNAPDVPGILKLVEDEGIERVCFYHLAYTGRGAGIHAEDLSTGETRGLLDLLMDWTVSRGAEHKEVLTVDNHADGAYLYLRLKRDNSPSAAAVYQLLEANGGNASGISIANIDSTGNIHPDQFWREVTLGNVRERPFSQVWMDTQNELMVRLRARKTHLKGRCGRCKFIDICNGNLRARAFAATGDIWAEDPACYLTDAEIEEGP